MSGASGSHDAQITFNSVECALLDISSSGRTPTNIAKPILSALLQHSAPCSGPLVLAGCIALVGNATVYDQQLIAHAINATMHALGAEDIARLSYEALGVREILSSVEEIAASALDALGVPACVSESQFWRLSLPAIFGLIYGGVEPGCDVPALRSFREQLLLETENKSQAVTSEPLEREQTGEEVLEAELMRSRCKANRRRVRFAEHDKAASSSSSSSSSSTQPHPQTRAELRQEIRPLLRPYQR